MAKSELRPFPDTARATEYKMAQFVNTLVGRPIHVAIVKGLKRKLVPGDLLVSCRPLLRPHLL